MITTLMPLLQDFIKRIVRDRSNNSVNAQPSIPATAFNDKYGNRWAKHCVIQMPSELCSA